MGRSSGIAWTQSRNGQDIAPGVLGAVAGCAALPGAGRASDAEPAPCSFNVRVDGVGRQSQGVPVCLLYLYEYAK